MANKKVLRSGPFKDLIASAVQVGDLITLSGQVSVDQQGEVVGAGDIERQTRRCYELIKRTLAELDASMDDIVDEVWLVTDVQDVMSRIETLWAIRAEAYGRNPDVTQTLVQVGGLVFPELLIEIKCIARS